uniref:VWA domain-containing protein n=1 Tax=mine drainage metagenome TaxID=410659 RepID=E6PYJ8_9ZZZZ
MPPIFPKSNRYTSTLILALPLLALLAIAPAARAQQQPQPVKKPAFHLIATDLIVTDAQGHRVTNLQKQDFTILDNGVQRPILAFFPTAAGQATQVASASANAPKPQPPTTVSIVIDNVNTPDILLAYVRQAVEKFLHLNNGALITPVAVYLFNGHGAVLAAGPSTDGNKLAAQLEQSEASQRPFLKLEGFYNLTDRMQLSLDTFGSFVAQQSTIPGHKMVFWIGRGWPMMIGTETWSSKKEATAYFNGLTAAWAGMRHARMTLYAIDPSRTPDFRTVDWEKYVDYLNPVKRPQDADVGNISVEVLAKNSGGLVLPFSGETSLSETIARCMHDVNKNYFLAFATPVDPQPDQYHSLTITVDKPGLTVRTRAGFYSEP